MPQTFMLGFLSLSLLFFLCLFVVIGCKICYLSIKNYFIDKYFTPKKAPSPPKPQKESKPKPTPKPIRSIEINPNEVDRIYVKSGD